MKIHLVALGLLALSCSACDNDPTSVVVGSGAGNTEIPPIASPEGLVFPGTLASYPLAVTQDGRAWLYAGSYSSMGPGYPGTWSGAHVWKVNPNGIVEFEMLLDANGFGVEPVAIHADNQGNIVILGHVDRAPGSGQTMPMGGQSVTFPYVSSAFVAKLAPTGKLLWIKVIDRNTGTNPDGTLGSLYLLDVGTDDAGEIHIAANLLGTTNFGGGLITHDDALVFVLSSEGKHLRDRILVKKDTAFLKLEVEPSGDSWVARSSLFLQAGIERFDTNGATTFQISWPICWVDAMRFALDGQGGFFSARTEDVAEHCSSMTMLHQETSGMPQWQIDDGASYYAVRPALMRGHNGRAWLGLGLEGTISLAKSTIKGTTIDDIVLAEIDDQGNVLQTATYGGPGVDEMVQMGMDASGARFMTGYFADTINFGLGALHNNTGDSRAIFLARVAQ